MTECRDDLQRRVAVVRQRLRRLRRRASAALADDQPDLARTLLQRRRNAATELRHVVAGSGGADAAGLRVEQRLAAVERLVEATLAELPAAASPMWADDGVENAVEPEVEIELDRLRGRINRQVRER